MTAPSVHVLADARHVAGLAAELLANRMLARPGLRLLMPTGHTPLELYAELRRRRAAGLTDPRGAEVMQLDEYRGLDPDGPHGYRAYLRRELSGTGLELTHWLEPRADDIEAECARYQELLDERPADVAVLGLGRDGHVGFDEPGSEPLSGVRVVRLADATRADAAGDFGGLEHVPREALTVGLRTLLEARELLLLVTGAAKAEALHAALSGEPRPELPASLLRLHPRLTVLCDPAAASRLGADSAVRVGIRGHVTASARDGIRGNGTASARDGRCIVVLGHREAGISPEHRASPESYARLERAAALAERDPARAVILTGFTSTAGLSEAEQMATRWRGHAPLLLEVAGHDTAENATRTLPLVLALGGIGRVTVVTSAWHLRAPLYFAPFRRFGLTLRFAFTPAGDWARMLVNEARLLPRVPAARRAAWAEVRLPPR